MSVNIYTRHISTGADVVSGGTTNSTGLTLKDVQGIIRALTDGVETTKTTTQKFICALRRLCKKP